MSTRPSEGRDAQLLDDSPGAWWRSDQIEAGRLSASAAAFELKRIVVAIDPAVSVGEDSDETGIIVAAIEWRDHAYVLEDLSASSRRRNGLPAPVNAFRRHAADRIIVETNMGGDLVQATIRVVDKNVPIRRVTAKRGKMVRAEPVFSTL